MQSSLKHHSSVLLLVILACGIPRISVATKSHPITTFLDAKWNVTPIALEAAEFLADDSPSYYWKFIDELNSLRPALSRLDTDSKQYNTIIRLAKNLLGDAQTELLKLSLSLRSLSPRIQAHLQIARDVLENSPDCKSDVFVVIGKKTVCTFEAVEPEINRQYEAYQKNKKGIESVQQFNFDQVFPGSDSHPVVVILYNEIGSESSRRWHELLQEKSLNGVVKLINRHYVHKQLNQKVRLSGYGVELHMKSTEYKSQDDDAPKQADDDDVPAENVETEINGFDFAVLK